ncbi:dihydrodipicolinate synthase family protein [Brevibacterium antiquum]|uniref:4-hydroxy-tetrahydrodipicolinate synthase n=1 Tax=Brevibacterium antiquum TaxID=234835 RepID=A0A2H1KTH7_9MICO|nr:dihydrodipicolinate synthase family protein [Brevibacterium antiquum]SMY02542.1 4-hydroxy-tetrahydrodipicolinate synthase [Brevibacterium antiquum]
MSLTFTGIYAACITPFSPDGGEIDIAGIGTQVEHMIANGVHGLVPGGSTGEFTALTVAERKACNRAYIQAADKRVPVVAGTGALSTAETIELSRDAEEAGADALMIVPPFYDTPSFEEIIAHYRAVSEVVDIPIMFYNIPDATGLEVSAEQFGRLGREAGVGSYKDTSGDFSKFTSVYLDHSDDIRAINGCDTLTFAALALGTNAGVWGAASFIPRLCVDLYNALAVDSDMPRARDLWEKIHPICVFLESHSYACGVKTGVELVGMPAGPTRGPILPLAAEHREELQRLLNAAGLETVA